MATTDTLWIGETIDWTLDALAVHPSGSPVNGESGLAWRLYDPAASADVEGMSGDLTYVVASAGDYAFSTTASDDLVEGNEYWLFVEGMTAQGPIKRRIKCAARYRAKA